MFLKRVVFVIFVLLLGLSNVKSVNDSSQPGSSQGFKKERTASHQRQLENILKYLEENRKHEEVTRTRETPAQDHDQKQLRLNQQIELDKLELRIRQQIERLLDAYAGRQPFKEEYVQQLNKDIVEINKIIQGMKERRIQESRAHDLRQIQIIQQQLNTRMEFEQKLSTLEFISNNQIAKKQRLAEQESFKSSVKTLEDNLKCLKDWHTRNQQLSTTTNIPSAQYNLIKYVIEQNMDSYKFITNQISKRRSQEVLAEKQKIAKLKEDLDSRRKYELEQRKRQNSPNYGMIYTQRKNDEFIEDTLDQGIRLQITNIENRLTKNNFLDKGYTDLSELLKQNLLKFKIHIRRVQQRRNQEQNVQVIQKGSGFKQSGIWFKGQKPSPTG